MAPIFREKGFDFHAELVRSVRDWKAAIPQVGALSGAYRRRNKMDETVVPHSYTFIQRKRASAKQNVAHPYQVCQALCSRMLKNGFHECIGHQGLVMSFALSRPSFRIPT